MKLESVAAADSIDRDIKSFFFFSAAITALVNLNWT